MLNDLRYVARSLAKTPGVTVAAVTVLALGIGLNTAVFSVVQALLLRPLPFRHPEQLVTVAEVHSKTGYGGSNYDNFLDWSRACTTCERSALISTRTYTLPPDPPDAAIDPDEIGGASVTSSFFSLLGVRPQLGRSFVPEDERSDRASVVILGDGLWQRRFGGSADVIGRNIRLGERDFQIVGVMPRSFRFNYGDIIDLWTPYVRRTWGRMAHQYGTIARLKPGVSLAVAQAELNVIAARLQQQFPETNTNWGFLVEPMQRAGDLADPLTGRALLLALAATGVVLLIACTNLAGLLLARSVQRARETAIRVAVGASRGRLVRLALAESLSLSWAGAILGLLLAPWCTHALAALVPAYLQPETDASMDRWVLAFAAASAIVTGLLAGLAPALRMARLGASGILKQQSTQAGTGHERARLLGAMIVGEVALALTLVVAAGLLVRSLARLMETPLGYRTEHLLTMLIRLPSEKYREPARAAAFYDDLLTRVQGLPGVVASGVGSSPPLSGQYGGARVVPEGQPDPADWRVHMALGHDVSAGYFRALGIALLRGREFTKQDERGAEPVAIINAALARRDWAGVDPLGRRLRVGGELRTIVGIVADVRHQGPGRRIEYEVYIPDVRSGSMFLALRVNGEPTTLAAPVRAHIRALDPGVFVLRTRTMERALGQCTSEQRAVTGWAAGFSMLALLLAATGLFGIVARSAAQRTHELGVRAALGASRASIVRSVLGRTLLLAALGTALGVGVSYAVAQSMRSLLYGVAPGDPATLVCAALVVMATALAAGYIPARRAAKVDPMVALRCE